MELVGSKFISSYHDPVLILRRRSFFEEHKFHLRKEIVSPMTTNALIARFSNIRERIIEAITFSWDHITFF